MQREEEENKREEAIIEKREPDTEEKIAHNSKLQAEMARARKDILEMNPDYPEEN